MMALNLVVFAGFYPPALHAVRYANLLAQALHGRMALLHVERASQTDPFALAGEAYRQQELLRQTNTAAALYRLAEQLHPHPTVEVAVDLLPEMAQDLAHRHHPALFVLSQPDVDQPDASGPVAACAGLLRAGHHPLLLVPCSSSTPTNHPPRRILIAADQEPFLLAPMAQALRQLLALPGAELMVAHVSAEVEDDAGCAAALRAVRASGLLQGLPTPQLRGYVHDDYAAGLLAAVEDTQADLLVVLARQRSYLGELFHRSVTARLLEQCPVPLLVLPTASKVPTDVPDFATTVAHWTNVTLAGLVPATRSHIYMPKN